MAKRFHDTNIWQEDWFIALPKDYRYFWLYLKDDCDHAGIWRPKVASFNKMHDCNVDLKKALELFNQDRQEGKRVVVLKSGRWFLTGFIPFQYGKVLNLASHMHQSIYSLLSEFEVNLTLIRPQIEVMDRVKDKDKDIYNKEGGMGGELEKRFGRIAKDEEVVKFLVKTPKALWPTVRAFLSKRWKDGAQGYARAEKVALEELRK